MSVFDRQQFYTQYYSPGKGALYALYYNLHWLNEVDSIVQKDHPFLESNISSLKISLTHISKDCSSCMEMFDHFNFETTGVSIQKSQGVIRNMNVLDSTKLWRACNCQNLADYPVLTMVAALTNLLPGSRLESIHPKSSENYSFKPKSGFNLK